MSSMVLISRTAAPFQPSRPIGLPLCCAAPGPPIVHAAPGDGAAGAGGQEGEARLLPYRQSLQVRWTLLLHVRRRCWRACKPLACNVALEHCCGVITRIPQPGTPLPCRFILRTFFDCFGYERLIILEVGEGPLLPQCTAAAACLLMTLALIPVLP